MEKITSKQNTKVKEWAKLKTKKGRSQSGNYLLEGWHLVHEAILNHEPIQTILVTETELNNIDLPKTYEVVIITDDIAKHIASTVTPQGVFAVLRMPTATPLTAETLKGAWLMLDQVQDPGNIGTMVRTADAAGFEGVIFGTGASSRYTPKVVRSMQGSQFHIKLIDADLNEVIDLFTANNLPVYGTELNPEAKPFRAIDPQPNFGLIMGNEGNGMSAELLKKTTANLYIPIKGQAESLNVAVAAGIIMFQLLQ